MTTALSIRLFIRLLYTASLGILLVAAADAAEDRVFGEPIRPLPVVEGLDPAKVALGERLFSDRRLSADDTVACANCHGLDSAGVDKLPRSFGIGGRQGTVNAPTVYNSAFNFRQFWDGRAATLEEQVAGPVHNPLEMGSNWAEVAAKLKADPAYRAAFEGLYPGGVDGASIADAIAIFERSLVTPSRFDRYLRGDDGALSEGEKQGYRLFKSYGCTACHQGVNVGGNMYQRFGLFGDYFADRGGDLTQADLGRFNVTGDENDRFRFKVPGLRNVARTAPYFHDGSVSDLGEAVRIMAHYQLGRALPEPDVAHIVQFLQSLTGRYQDRDL